MKKRLIFWACVLGIVLFSSAALAEGAVYEIHDESGQFLTHIHGECETGDEYISGNNQHYRITKVNNDSKTATAKHLGNANLPDVSWLDMDKSLPVAALGDKKIALYCTHSDESYITGDGTESVEGRGGIYDIADRFASSLKERGVSVELSDATHLPHDAGAYRRSRQTAVSLLKGRPDAIFDLHRDGIPDPDEYAVKIGNEKMSKIRLLVGKSNQNKEANLSFAKQIKAVADKIYPGLIKDIYMGKGSYNQDLAPRSVLLEFGTHTLDKSLVLKSVPLMSEVIYKAMYGGVTGSAGASDVSSSSSAKSEKTVEESKTASENNTGSGWAVWLIAALIAGIGFFALLSTGGKGAMTKFSRNISEMTGGLFGRKPDRKK